MSYHDSPLAPSLATRLDRKIRISSLPKPLQNQIDRNRSMESVELFVRVGRGAVGLRQGKTVNPAATPPLSSLPLSLPRRNRRAGKA